MALGELVFAMDVLDIDAAVASAALFQMTPPAIERPLFNLRESDAALAAKLEASERKARADFRAWIDRSQREMLSLEAAMAANPVQSRHLEVLLQAALAIEEDAERSVFEARQREKRLLKLLKQVAEVSRPAAKVVQTSLENISKFAREETEARLDGALSFRALRSRYMPDNDTDIEIRDPRDVEKMLREAMASV